MPLVKWNELCHQISKKFRKKVNHSSLFVTVSNFAWKSKHLVSWEIPQGDRKGLDFWWWVWKIDGKVQNSHAAATAKLLQLCPTLCDPRDGSPPGTPVPGILQARTLEWAAISFSNVWKWKVKVKSLSPIRLSATPWTAAHHAPPSMGLSRQENWSGVPLPSPNFPLASYFTHGNVYISMSLSRFVPPAPAPAVSVSLFPMSESIPALQIGSSIPTF